MGFAGKEFASGLTVVDGCISGTYFFQETWDGSAGGYKEQTGYTDWEDQGMVHVTRDRGRTWTSMPDLGGAIIGSVFGIESGKAWAGGSGEVIYKIENRSLSLQNLSPEGSRGYWGYSGRWLSANYVINGLFFLDENTGWSAGDRILHTTDGGRNWVEEEVFGDGSGPFLTRMDRAGNRLIVVGQGGRIMSRQIEEVETAVETVEQRPMKFELLQPHPNPFNDQIRIPYRLSEPGMASLEVFNLLGQKISNLVGQVHSAGDHTAYWSAHGHASGVYFVHLTHSGERQVKRLLVLR